VQEGDVGAIVLVQTQRAELEREWADEGQRTWLAPGEEILASVFHHVGAMFDKRSDAPSIARNMATNEIAPEIAVLVARVGAVAP
jgi:hypothetical protein